MTLTQFCTSNPDLLYGIFLALILYVPPFVHDMYCLNKYGNTYADIVAKQIEAICANCRCLYRSEMMIRMVFILPILIIISVATMNRILYGHIYGYKYILYIIIVVMPIIIILGYCNYKYALCIVTDECLYIKNVSTLFRLTRIPLQSIDGYKILPVPRNRPGVTIVTKSKKYNLAGVSNIYELFLTLDSLKVKCWYPLWGWGRR